ncbi:MAG: glycyl-radical enzyme activating protein [Lachnospiraceae bacterium]|nr:glycyl-radical enzyme activating protein [Lachnospiraceae bacterium]
MPNIDYNLKGCVFNIQRFSINDGPGIRTIVFLKGCPLRCKWCFNPESQSPEPAQGYGEMMTVEQVTEEIAKDQGHYRRSGGGITFSGGEALMQADFVEQICYVAQAHGWNTAIETTAYASPEAIKKVIPLIDHVMMDIKALPSDLHAEGTGVPNDKILENALLVNSLAKELIIRVPVIPEFNFSEQQIQYICRFVKYLDKVKEIHLLPYNTFGVSKYEELGREYALKNIQPLHAEDLEPLAETVRNFGFRCKIGG